MGLLEDALRDTFTSQVAAPPVLDGLADRAIRRAGRVRRRRTVLVSAAALVSVGILGVGVASVAGGRGPAQPIGGPTSPANPTASAGPSLSATPLPLVGVVLPADVLNGDRIQVANGAVVSLAGMGSVSRAWRVAEGWLVDTYQYDRQTAMVWLVTEAGGQTLLASGDSVMVSAGSASRPGPQVGWRAGGTLFLGSYRDGHVAGIVSTDGVALNPQRLVGSGLLLAGTRTGGGLDIWDMWFPDKGPYKDTTENLTGLSTVLGTTIDNERIIALFGGKPPCLGELDPDGFTAVKSNCPVNVGLDDKVFPSPDGRWWAVTGEFGVALYDAQKVWNDATPASTWSSVRGARNAVWLDGGTAFVVATPTEVITIDLTGGGLIDTVPLPASGVGGTIMPIADLR